MENFETHIDLLHFSRRILGDDSGQSGDAPLQQTDLLVKQRVVHRSLTWHNGLNLLICN